MIKENHDNFTPFTAEKDIEVLGSYSYRLLIGFIRYIYLKFDQITEVSKLLYMNIQTPDFE